MDWCSAFMILLEFKGEFIWTSTSFSWEIFYFIIFNLIALKFVEIMLSL